MRTRNGIPCVPKELQSHRLYIIFRHMRKRCYSPSNKDYSFYGGRGITICDEWNNDFTSFYNWALTNGYSDGLTIDRKDVDGSYNPNNCRWVTRAEQNRNKRDTHWITLFSETKILSDWIRDDRINVTKQAFLYRIKQGMTEQEALTAPDRRKRS